MDISFQIKESIDILFAVYFTLVAPTVQEN